ncbi:MAG: YhaN family protein [Isosphaeraceae bacterium]
MRIDRLDLIAFGPFTNDVLDLSSGSEGLHLIYGPNEAGKSSALRAIRQFFRGIPPQSDDDFIHQYGNMRIGATLRERSGETLELVRRKGSKNTLLGPDGKTLDDAEARLARFLGGVASEEFLRKFVIDHAELVEGGKIVVEGGGDLGRVLFAAGSGLGGLGAVQKALDEQAEALYKRGGSKPLINARISELELIRKQVKDDSLKPSEWLAHDEALRQARQRLQTLKQTLDQANRERNRLARIAEAIEPMARRRAILDELPGLADVPRLSSTFTYDRQEVLSLLHSNQEHDAKSHENLRELIGALESLDVPGPLLDQAEAIEELYQRLGRQRQSARDRDRIEGERDRLDAEARLILRDLGRPSTSGGDGDLDSLRMTTADRAEVLSLSGERAALLVALDTASAALKKLDAKRVSIAGKLDALGPMRDLAPLRKAVKQAMAQGDLDGQVRQEREALARDEGRAAVALDALGLWSGPLDAIEALPVPPVETVETYKDTFLAEDALENDLRQKIDEVDAHVRQVDAEIEQSRLAGDIPSEEALTEARERRDSAWRRLKQARAWDDTMAAEFEPAARRADELADRLRREASRVTERARLLAERSRLVADREALRAQVDDARRQREASRARWFALWAPLGVSAPWPPREMLAWLRKHADLAALARSIREARESVRLLVQKVADHRRSLQATMDALGCSLPDRPAVDEPLADAIERAEGLIETITEEASTRKRLTRDLDTLDCDRPALEESAATSRASWTRWEARWAAAMGPLGLPPDALPDTANAVLAKTADLFDRLDKAREHNLTLGELEREAARFNADVGSLAARVAPDLVHDRAGFEPETVADALYQRLKAGRAAREKQESLTERRLEQERAALSAGNMITELRGKLALLCREARCADEEDLPAIEERSARRQDLEKALANLNAVLGKLTAGAPLETFLAEAAQADPDALPSRIDHQNEMIAALERERSELDQTIGGETTYLSLMNGSPKAADAGQVAEDLRARIKSDIEEYARLRLASTVLRAGIERYRKKVQDPVLERASALFARLTLGSFESLRVDYNDRDEPVLKGVRSIGREPLGVESMSLGTADQLYLSLRLATLETYLDHREPLPLIVDDVLIQFDNARSAATLEVLASLSRRTQVLVFTHHEHLRDLAEAQVPADLLFIHTLSGPSRAFVANQGRPGVTLGS